MPASGTRSFTMPVLLRLTLVIPVATVTVVASLTGLGARIGLQTLDEEAPRNPSDAAIRRNLAALIEFRQKGDDLRRRYTLQPRYTEFDARTATPLESAILSRSIEAVRLVLRVAPPLHAAERHAAACLALDVNAGESIVAAVLDDAMPPVCTAGAALATLRSAR